MSSRRTRRGWSRAKARRASRDRAHPAPSLRSLRRLLARYSLTVILRSRAILRGVSKDSLGRCRPRPILRGSPLRGERLRMTAEIFCSRRSTGSTLKPSNRRSRTCECIPILVLKTSLILFASCPMRGASRGVTEVGQSESWPEGQPEGRCGARGCASQAWTRGALGNRPSPLSRVCLKWLGGTGEGWAKACLDGELARACAGSTVPGTKKSLRWSVRKALLLLSRRVVRRSISPQKGRSTKSPTRAAARGRERLAV
jgi:hypothetical protein